jgi:hypothetical protein
VGPLTLPKKDKIDKLSVAKRNYYPLATVANKKKCLPLTQLCGFSYLKFAIIVALYYFYGFLVLDVMI